MKTTQIPLADDVIWSDGMTAYDEAHFTLYVRLLDAVNAGAKDDEMCKVLLEIDADREPERAQRRLQSHLKRARWYTEEGFRHLIADNVSPPKKTTPHPEH
ncbi:MAG TPA: DUF2285 domain-containing protein [Rhizomicrobium sp.]